MGPRTLSIAENDIANTIDEEPCLPLPLFEIAQKRDVVEQ